MGITYEGDGAEKSEVMKQLENVERTMNAYKALNAPAKPKRRRRSALRRSWERVWRWLRYIGDANYARRHDAGKKAAATRKRKSMAVKASTPKDAPSQETTRQCE